MRTLESDTGLLGAPQTGEITLTPGDEFDRC
jgi:hypothetical protein